MKRLFNVILGAVILAAMLPLTASAAFVTTDTFTDSAFRAYIKENFDKDGDGYLSDEEREAVTYIDIRSKSIRSLRGINLFPNLTTLRCSDNMIGSLDFTYNPKIMYIDCMRNKISGTALRRMVNSLPEATGDFFFLYFRSSDESEANTESFPYDEANAKGWNCYVGGKLVTSNASVTVTIDEATFPDEIFRNYLLSLDEGRDGMLTEAEIDGLTVLDVSNKDIKSLKGIERLTALMRLNCKDNDLTSLDLSYNAFLEYFNCSHNRIFGQEMSNLVESLPLPAATSDNPTLAIMRRCNLYNPEETTGSSSPNRYEGNVVSEDQYSECFNEKHFWSSNPGAANTYYETFGGDLIINPRTFPDEVFRTFISSRTEATDGKIPAAKLATTISMTPQNLDAADLTGIEYYYALQVLLPTNGMPNITEMPDFSRNTNLTRLKLDKSQIKAQVISPDFSKLTKLQYLYCNNMKKLQMIDVSALEDLKYFSCYSSNLSYLKIRPVNDKPLTAVVHHNPLRSGAWNDIIYYIKYFSSLYPDAADQTFQLYSESTTSIDNMYFDYSLLCDTKGTKLKPQYYRNSEWKDYNYDHVLYAEDVTIEPGTPVTLPIHLVNSNNSLNEFSFSIVLPEGFSLTGAEAVESRLPNHTILRSQSSSNPRVWYVIVRSTGNWPIRYNSGKVMDLKLSAANKASDYVRLQNVILKTTGNTEIHSGPLTSRITINKKLGDVNSDGSVTPADAIMILYHYFNVVQTGFDESVADVNRDQNISPADAIEALYIYFGATGNSRQAGNRPAAEYTEPE